MDGESTANVCSRDSHRVVVERAQSRGPLRSISLAMSSPDVLRSYATVYLETNPVDGWASLATVINVLKKAPELNGAKPLDIKNTVEQIFAEKFGPKEAAKQKIKVCFEFLVHVPI